MTVRLCLTAAEHWAELDGWALSSGIMTPLLDLPQDRFEHLVWWFLTRNVQDAEELESMKARLWQPPKGVEPTTGPWSAEAEMAAFRAVKQQVQG